MEKQPDRGLPTFRAEAMAHRARRQGPGEMIKLSPGWTGWAFYVIIGLFLTSVVALSVIEIDRYARGTAVTDDSGRVVVLVPAALAPDVAEGNPVELEGATTTVRSFEDTVLYPTEVQERFGVEVTVPSVAVATSARPDQATTGGARVLIESEPALVALVPGLKALFQVGDA